jgi:hypothetical protein
MQTDSGLPEFIPIPLALSDLEPHPAKQGNLLIYY